MALVARHLNDCFRISKHSSILAERASTVTTFGSPTNPSFEMTKQAAFRTDIDSRLSSRAPHAASIAFLCPTGAFTNKVASSCLFLNASRQPRSSISMMSTSSSRSFIPLPSHSTALLKEDVGIARMVAPSSSGFPGSFLTPLSEYKRVLPLAARLASALLPCSPSTGNEPSKDGGERARCRRADCLSVASELKAASPNLFPQVPSSALICMDSTFLIDRADAIAALDFFPLSCSPPRSVSNRAPRSG
mmetsp:Transcript_7717/g.26086  ORF Transcript_7717/g.26086 Transcript_7717/m.26086 type:complete len:248 (-) Transcript_7717:319-1062(-)